MIFLWLHVSHLCSIGSKEWNWYFEKNFEKWFFCWLRFSHLWSIGVETVKKLTFWKKNLKNFSNHKMVWNGIQKISKKFRKISKSGFFADFAFLTCEVSGSKQWKNWLFEKKTWKTFQIIKWSEMEFKKFNLKIVRSKPKFYAK